MYSSARIAGHPIPPMVIGIPVALFSATLAALLAFIGTHHTLYYRAAMVTSVSGVTMAALAATAALRSGIKHGSIALATVGMFAIAAAVLYRNWAFKTMVDGAWQLDATVPLAITTLGMVALVIVGMLGIHVGIKTAPVPSRQTSRVPYRASPQPS